MADPRNPEDISDADGERMLAKIYAKHDGMSLDCVGDVAKLINKLSGRKLHTSGKTVVKTPTTTIGDRNFVHLGLMKGLLLKMKKGIHPTSEVRIYFFSL